MKIRYAATASNGQRFRDDSREAVDRWAAGQVKRGADVEVYSARRTDKGNQFRVGWADVELVGVWRA